LRDIWLARLITYCSGMLKYNIKTSIVRHWPQKCYINAYSHELKRFRGDARLQIAVASVLSDCDKIRTVYEGYSALSFSGLNFRFQRTNPLF
jgi:hypothetical protein